MALPFTLANGKGNLPDATQLMANFNALLLANGGSTFIGIGRNRLCNAEMLFDQRKEGAAYSINNNGGSGQYTLDWHKAFNGQNGRGVFSVQQITSGGPNASLPNFIRVKTTTSSTATAAEFYALEFTTEACTTRDFLFGTAAAKTITFSFWVRSSLTGNFGASIETAPGDRSYTFIYNIPVANTWTYITQTIPGDTAGTWVSGPNLFGLLIGIDIGSGSNFQTTVGTWQGGDLFATSGSVKLIGTLNATLDITGIQLEIGPIATSFEYKPFDVQLRDCQRIYEKSYLLGVAPGTAGATNTESATAGLVGTNTPETGMIRYKVPKAFKAGNTTVTLYTAANGTVGKWLWYTAGGTGTERVSTVNNSGSNGFDMYQLVASELWATGHWACEVFLAS